MKNFMTIALVSLAFLIITGCAKSQSTRYYLLSPISTQSASSVDKGLSVCIGPIQIPEYLDRVEIVTRVNENQYKLAEFDSWAEPLEASVPRILGQNLASLVSINKAFYYPCSWSDGAEYQIEVDFIRFDGNLNGSAELSATWSIYQSGQESKLLAKKSATFNETAQPNDYQSLVSALSRALGALSQDIGAELKLVSQRGKNDKP
jgi:hypothetical protein